MIFTIVDPGQDHKVVQGPGIPGKGDRFNLFFLDFTPGPLDIKNRRGVKLVFSHMKVNLSPIVLDNLRHKKAWPAVKPPVFGNPHLYFRGFHIFIQDPGGHLFA